MNFIIEDIGYNHKSWFNSHGLHFIYTSNNSKVIVSIFILYLYLHLCLYYVIILYYNIML